MPLSHLKRLCTLLPFSTSAAWSESSTTTASPTPPNPPQNVLPTCAQPCLQAAIIDQFPVACSSPVSLSCLCAQYSTGGESLGEIALGCLHASCTTVNGSRTTAAYNICLGQRDAVPGTQTALTITLASTITLRSTTEPRSSTSTKSDSRNHSPSTTSTSVSRTSSSVDIDSIPAISFLSTSHSTTTSSAAVATSSAPVTAGLVMKPAQIAGLAAGAVAAFVLAIALMALSIFLRRRREKREPEDEQGDHFPAVNYSRGYPDLFPDARPSDSHSPDRQSWLAASSTNLLAASRTEVPTRKRESHRFTGPTIRQVSLAEKIDPFTDSVPLDQIGVAISEAGPSTSGTNSVARQQRPRSLRFTINSEQRPDSLISQQTLFEEDERRRSSKLLPTPPIPVGPAQALQQIGAYPTQPPIRTQPSGLPLQIPRKRPRMLVPASKGSTRLQAPLTGPAPRSERTREAVSTFSLGASNSDIPDYYFTAHEPPLPALAPAHIESRTRQAELSRGARVRPKASSSTLSRAPSRASSRDRGSISSQTSFESADNDPTPEEEDDTKKLSPVAESPISTLRYPKVPRASNQLVPRSPRSPRTPQSQGSPTRPLEASDSPFRRKEGLDMLAVANRLRMDSPLRPGERFPIKPYQRHTRGSSMDTGSTVPSLRHKDRQSRVQSGHWSSSPLMYDIDAVEPLRIRNKHQDRAAPEMEALRSPTWIPSLSPPASRRGDDLFFSVTYSKPGQRR